MNCLASYSLHCHLIPRGEENSYLPGSLYFTIFLEAYLGLCVLYLRPALINFHNKVLCRPTFKMNPVKTKPATQPLTKEVHSITVILQRQALQTKRCVSMSVYVYIYTHIYICIYTVQTDLIHAKTTAVTTCSIVSAGIPQHLNWSLTFAWDLRIT